MSSWIERQKNILDFTLFSLLRRKGKNSALLAVYALIVFLLASVMFFTDSIKKEASLLLRDSPEMIVQRTSAGRHELIPAGYIERIADIRGIQAVRGRLWGYYYDPITGANYTMIVPEDGQDPAGTISIGEGVSRSRLASPGDSLEFRTSQGEVIELEVGKIFSRDSALVSSDLVLVSAADFRRLFGGTDGFFTDLVIRARNSKELPTIALKIAERLPDTRIILREEILRTYEAVFNWRGGLLVLILAGAALAFMILAWDKGSGLSQEERREIGILKAIGWETSDVILLKFWEGAVVSLTAFLAGTLLAYAHIYLGSATLFEPVLKGWSVIYPKFTLTPFIDAAQIAALFFLTVVPYTVATVIPSWRAATTDPDSVMR
jgi:ABC-type lipoprotein release transport system permease subunit